MFTFATLKNGCSGLVTPVLQKAEKRHFFKRMEAASIEFDLV